jgi:hypothetical protein
VDRPSPAFLGLYSGGPQSAKVDRTCDTCIAAKSGYGRGRNTGQKQDASDRLASVEIQLIEGIDNETALKQVFAHEIGHTFGLDDCYVNAADSNNKPLYDCSKTVMASGIIVEGDPNAWTSTMKNATKTDLPNGLDANGKKLYTQGFELLAGPTACDMSIIDRNLPDYRTCPHPRTNAQLVPTCTNGTTQGFMDTGGLSGQYTCGGVACDGCNSNCSNFAPQNCGSGGGGSTTCQTWCGSICMDTAVCSDGTKPYCNSTSGGFIPACSSSSSPIVIDAFEEGFHLTSLGNGVKFRVQPSQEPLQMSWTDPNWRNGWLAFDRNGNGTVDDFTELFGNMTPQPLGNDPNGYLALAVFDDPMNGGNGNGVIDPGDSVYDHLWLWIDANHNGISEPDERHTLRDAGIFQIDLKYHLSKYVDQNGNRFRYKARVWDQAGDAHDLCYDVFLSIQVPMSAGSH